VIGAVIVRAVGKHGRQNQSAVWSGACSGSGGKATGRQYCFKSAFAQSLSPGKSARTSAPLFKILNFAFARFCFWVLRYHHSRQNKAYYVSRLE
jgi:hypothetical protein